MRGQGGCLGLEVLRGSLCESSRAEQSGARPDKARRSKAAIFPEIKLTLSCL